MHKLVENLHNINDTKIIKFYNQLHTIINSKVLQNNCSKILVTFKLSINHLAKVKTL